MLNAPAWEWLQQAVFDDRMPVIDHMWQTETGGPIFGNPYGYAHAADQARLGRASRCPGSRPTSSTRTASRSASGEKGIMRIKRPFPGLIATLWGEPERYVTDYWEKIPGGYYVGDAAHIDEDGYVWFAGRADEIIKIAAHRLGTIEVETAFLRHPAVAEAGVDGRAGRAARRGDRGVRRPQGRPRAVRRARAASCSRPSAHELGPVAVIGELTFVAMLPKTRSGKIMRRVLKAVVARPRPRRHHHDRGRGLGRGGAPRGRGAASRHRRLSDGGGEDGA